MKTNAADSLARRPGLAAIVVMLLHLGLLLVVVQTRDRPLPRIGAAPPAQPQPAWLWLRPAPAVPAQALPARAPAPTRPTPRRAPGTAVASPLATPAEGTLTLVPAPAPGPTVPAPPLDRPAAEAPRPLNLSLPRSASAPMRNPALDDPRSNSRVAATLESRLAAVMASSDGPLTQEVLPDGSVIFRRGASCVIVRPSRSATIDPFNQSVSPKPRTADSC